MQVIRSSTFHLNSLSQCQNFFFFRYYYFVRVFNWISHSHAIFMGLDEKNKTKKLSQQRNQITNESTDKNAHKFISAIIRLIRSFGVQATTDFLLGIFPRFQEFQFYLWFCAVCLFSVGGIEKKKRKRKKRAHSCAPYTFRLMCSYWKWWDPPIRSLFANDINCLFIYLWWMYSDGVCSHLEILRLSFAAIYFSE